VLVVERFYSNRRQPIYIFSCPLTALRLGTDVKEKVLLIMGCVVVGVWTISVIMQEIFPDRVVPDRVHEITLAVIVGLFGGAAIAGRKGPKDDE
jgi:hypothetical protein